MTVPTLSIAALEKQFNTSWAMFANFKAYSAAGEQTIEQFVALVNASHESANAQALGLTESTYHFLVTGDWKYLYERLSADDSMKGYRIGLTFTSLQAHAIPVLHRFTSGLVYGAPTMDRVIGLDFLDVLKKIAEHGEEALYADMLAKIMTGDWTVRIKQALRDHGIPTLADSVHAVH